MVVLTMAHNYLKRKYTFQTGEEELNDPSFATQRQKQKLGYVPPTLHIPPGFDPGVREDFTETLNRAVARRFLQTNNQRYHIPWGPHQDFRRPLFPSKEGRETETWGAMAILKEDPKRVGPPPPRVRKPIDVNNKYENRRFGQNPPLPSVVNCSERANWEALKHLPWMHQYEPAEDWYRPFTAEDLEGENPFGDYNPPAKPTTRTTQGIFVNRRIPKNLQFGKGIPPDIVEKIMQFAFPAELLSRVRYATDTTFTRTPTNQLNHACAHGDVEFFTRTVRHHNYSTLLCVSGLYSAAFHGYSTIVSKFLHISWHHGFDIAFQGACDNNQNGMLAELLKLVKDGRIVANVPRALYYLWGQAVRFAKLMENSVSWVRLEEGLHLLFAAVDLHEVDFFGLINGFPDQHHNLLRQPLHINLRRILTKFLKFPVESETDISK